jgi:hypothetical protein
VTLSSAVLALVRRDLDKVAPVPFGLPPRRRWFHPGKQGIRVDREGPAANKGKREKGHWCVLSPLRQITEQVRGKTVSSCTVAASVRGGRRSWKQLQRGSVAHGGELRRGDDGVLPRTGAAWHRGSRAASTSWAQRRGASQGVQERRRRRLPWTAVFTAPATAPAPSRRRRPWLGVAS